MPMLYVAHSMSLAMAMHQLDSLRSNSPQVLQVFGSTDESVFYPSSNAQAPNSL
jgi:hypothetical protein